MPPPAPWQSLWPLLVRPAGRKYHQARCQDRVEGPGPQAVPPSGPGPHRKRSGSGHRPLPPPESGNHRGESCRAAHLLKPYRRHLPEPGGAAMTQLSTQNPPGQRPEGMQIRKERQTITPRRANPDQTGTSRSVQKAGTRDQFQIQRFQGHQSREPHCDQY